MALRNLNSKFDLVKGQNPVGDMKGQTGPSFQLPIENASQKHIDSLTNDYSYQNGNSQITINPTSLDLNGNQGPDFDFSSKGPASIFQQSSLENMYTSIVNPEASYNSNWPQVGPVGAVLGLSSQDLNGNEGPRFDFSYKTRERNIFQQNSLLDVYESAVNPQVSYNSNWPQVGPVGAVLGLPSQDLNTTETSIGDALIFDNGPDSNLHENSLLGIYESTVNQNTNYGNSNWPQVGPVGAVRGLPSQDLNTTKTSIGDAVLFDNSFNGSSGNTSERPGLSNDLHEKSLSTRNGAPYVSKINPSTNYGNSNWPRVGPVGAVRGLASQDLNTTRESIGDALLFNGINRPAKGQGLQIGGEDLHINLLTNNYDSSINPSATYGAGQPGGTWPRVNPSPVGLNFGDLNGITPTGYVNPDTGNTY